MSVILAIKEAEAEGSVVYGYYIQLSTQPHEIAAPNSGRKGGIQIVNWGQLQRARGTDNTAVFRAAVLNLLSAVTF